MRVVLVMRAFVVPLGDPDVDVVLVPLLAGHRERDDTGEIGLIRQVHQIENQIRVLLERLGNPHRTLDQADRRRRALLLSLLDPPLDVAQGLEILVDAQTCRRREIEPQGRARRVAGSDVGDTEPVCTASSAAASVVVSFC